MKRLWAPPQRSLGTLGSAILLGLAIIVAGVSFWGGSAVSTARARAADTAPLQEFRLYDEVWSIVHREFVQPLPPASDVARGAATGLVGAWHDVNTRLLGPDLARVARQCDHAQCTGVGLGLRPGPDGRILVDWVGPAAAAAGVRPGNVLVSAAGIGVQGLGLIDAGLILSGKPGSSVSVVLRHSDGSTLSVALAHATRGQEVVSSILPSGAVYLALRGWPADVSAITAVINDSRAADTAGILVDLRGLCGGTLEEAVSVAGQLVGENVIASERGRDGQHRTYESQPGQQASALPMAVLVDSGSCAGAEAVAAAVRESGRGILVGERTYGSGATVRAVDLSDGSRLLISTAFWYTAGGQVIEGKGLEPDLAVQPGNDGSDAQLAAADRYLAEERR